MALFELSFSIPGWIVVLQIITGWLGWWFVLYNLPDWEIWDAYPIGIAEKGFWWLMAAFSLLIAAIPTVIVAVRISCWLAIAILSVFTLVGVLLWRGHGLVLALSREY